MSLKIDSEFKNLIPPLTPEEKTQLEQNILSDGCRDSLITWNGILVDGHNRYEICTRNKIQFRTEEKQFNSREDVIDWIICNQLGRRNITDMQKSYLRGLQFEREKKKRGGQGSNQYSKSEKTSDLQNKVDETAKRLAEQHKVTDRTIYTDAKFVKALDTISSNVGSDIKQKVLTKEIKTTKEDIMNVAKMPAEKQKEIFSNTTKVIKTKEENKVIPKPDKLETKVKEVNKNKDIEELERLYEECKTIEPVNEIYNNSTIIITEIRKIVNDSVHGLRVQIDNIKSLDSESKQAISQILEPIKNVLKDYEKIILEVINNDK